MKAEDITSEQMEETIRDLAYEDGTGIILDIPGVWECVAEHYNNEAIARILDAAEEEDESDG